MGSTFVNAIQVGTVLVSDSDGHRNQILCEDKGTDIVGTSVQYRLAGLMPGHGVGTQVISGVGTGDIMVTWHPPSIPVTWVTAGDC